MVRGLSAVEWHCCVCSRQTLGFGVRPKLAVDSPPCRWKMIINFIPWGLVCTPQAPRFPGTPPLFSYHISEWELHCTVVAVKGKTDPAEDNVSDQRTILLTSTEPWSIGYWAPTLSKSERVWWWCVGGTDWERFTYPYERWRYAVQWSPGNEVERCKTWTALC